MPLFEPPPTDLPTDRIPTPGEFIAEALRRNSWDPRTAGVAAMVEQIVLAARGPGTTHPDALREQLRMGALLALVIDGHYDEITEHAIHVSPPPGVADPAPLSWEQLMRIFDEEDR
jgi:hypothetical protein